MNENIELLYTNFLAIKNMGWIKSFKNGFSGVGYTFERLLGKEVENFRIPDYYGIEIKATRCFNNHKIYLFSATPDGDILFQIPRIVKKLGYPDKTYPEYKKFYATVNAKEYTSVGYKRIKLSINWEKEKIDLLAYSTYGKTFNLEISWSFQLLREVYCLKLNQLAIVNAYSKTINHIEYFLYNSIDFYKQKDFSTFLKLIEDGTIEINFQISIWKKGLRLGKIHDRGTCFSIMEKDIDRLFYKINN